MKVLIVLAAFVAVAAARPYYGAGPVAAPIAAVSTGTSSQFRSEDNYGNYNFGYDESHASGGTSRREEQVNGVRHGSYSLSDADGRRRQVNYVADATGFHATVQTNEPGVEPKDSADVIVNKAGPVAVAAYAGPVAAPLALPAPAPLLAGPAAPAVYAPAPVAVKGAYLAPRAPLAAPVLAAPAPVYAPAPAVYEPETPRAFSYSFGSTHLAAPAAAYIAPAPLAAPLPAPIYQQQEAY